MAEVHKWGIVRIFLPDGSEHGKTLGTGFVAREDGLVVTCAHVFTDAKPPWDISEPVPIEFLANGATTKARILPQYWRPSDREDVAILQVEIPESKDPIPIAAYTSSDSEVSEANRNKKILALPLAYSSHLKAASVANPIRLATFGFPKADPYEGLAGVCEIVGTKKDNGQFEVFSNRSSEVTHGFSGAPVWDDGIGGVVGMNVSIVEPGSDRSGRLAETAFFIPVETIRSVCDKLALPRNEPYRDLEEFEEKHEAFYFGRETASAQLVEMLANHDLVAVVGVSGSGKSSLVRAGLLKGLKAANSKLRERPRVSYRAGANPLLAQVAALAQDSAYGPEKVAKAFGLSYPLDRAKNAAELESKSVEAIAGALMALGKLQPLLLVCDQLERIYTDAATEETCRQFFAALAACACRDVKVVMAARADYYFTRMQEEGSFVKLIAKPELILLPMTDEELRAAIELPARALFRHFQPAVVRNLVQEVSNRPGDLPLLQFALTELWRQDNAKGVLTEASYQQLGLRDAAGKITVPGARGVIIRRAEEYYQELPNEPERQRFEHLFRLLINLPSTTPTTKGSDVSRRVLAGELDEPTLGLANRLANTFLLTPREDPLTGQRTFEVAHEALIRSWPLLQVWLKDEKRRTVWHQAVLVPAYKEWLTRQKSRDLLIRAKPILSEAESWLGAEGPDANADIHEFVRRSLEAERKRRFTKKVAVSAAAAILFALLGCVTWQLRRVEAERTRLRLQNAEQQFAKDGLESPESAYLGLGELAALLRDQPANRVAAERLVNALNQRGFLLPSTNHFTFTRQPFTSTARGNLSASVEEDSIRITKSDSGITLFVLTNAHRVVIRSVRMSADSAHLVSASGDGTAKIWDLASHQPACTISNSEGINYAEFSPNGSQVVTASRNTTTEVWDAKQCRKVSGPMLHKNSVNTAHFSPSGNLIITAADDDLARVWEAQTGDRESEPLRLDQGIEDVRFTDEAHVVVISERGEAQAFRLVGAQSLLPDAGPLERREDNADLVSLKKRLASAQAGEIITMDRSPDGSRLATASTDKRVRLWNAANLTPLSPKEGLNHNAIVNCVRFSPDGLRLVTSTAAPDQKVRLWDAQTGLPLSDSIASPIPVSQVDFSVDGNFITASGGWKFGIATIQGPVPPWLADLARAIAGLGGANHVSAAQDFLRVREVLLRNTSTNRLAQWAREFVRD